MPPAMTRPRRPRTGDAAANGGRQDHPRGGAGHRAGDHRPRRGRRAVHAPPRPRAGPGPDDLVPARAEQGGPARRRRRDRRSPSSQVDPADPDWAAQLRTVARDYRALALAHPHVVPLLVTRPLATPLALRPRGTLRPLEDILTLLTRAGFSGPDALHIYRALFGFLHGHVLNELQELVDNPDETDDLLRLGLHRLPIARIPPAAQPRPRPGRLRRRRRTRTRPRHPPHRADNHSQAPAFEIMTLPRRPCGDAAGGQVPWARRPRTVASE